MKITQKQLRQIIREELTRNMNEMDLPFMMGAFAGGPRKKKKAAPAPPAQNALSRFHDQQLAFEKQYYEKHGHASPSQISRLARERELDRKPGPAYDKSDLFKIPLSDITPEQWEKRQELWMGGRWLGPYEKIQLQLWYPDMETISLNDWITSGKWKDIFEGDENELAKDERAGLRSALQQVEVDRDGPMKFSLQEVDEIMRLFRGRDGDPVMGDYSDRYGDPWG